VVAFFAWHNDEEKRQETHRFALVQFREICEARGNPSGHESIAIAPKSIHGSASATNWAPRVSLIAQSVS
jgi:hypothetical protein